MFYPIIYHDLLVKEQSKRELYYRSIQLQQQARFSLYLMVRLAFVHIVLHSDLQFHLAS